MPAACAAWGYGVTMTMSWPSGFFANGEPAKLGLPLKSTYPVSACATFGSVRRLLWGSLHRPRSIWFPAGRWAGIFFRTERRLYVRLPVCSRPACNLPSWSFSTVSPLPVPRNSVEVLYFRVIPGLPCFWLNWMGRLLKYVLNANSLYHGGKSHRIQRSAYAEAEKLWQVRRTCSQSMYSLADTKLNEDVVVPLDRQAELIAYTLELKKQIGLPTPTYGHAGDGNLHVHIMYNRGNAEEAKRAREGILLLMKKVVALGGVITGEHGIGLAKAPFMELQHSAAEISVMRSVKEALDPKGILNPGKIFEPFEVWDHQPMDVCLPWDHR